MIDPDEADDLVDPKDLFGRPEYDFTRPSRKSFRPWHKPRKQLVRAEQWGPEIQYLSQRRIDDRRPVKYLTLPGPDMLDIRYYLESADYDICFFGFDESAKPNSIAGSDHNVSMHEIRRHPRVDLRSDVIGDEFELLANLDSVAWERMSSLGTFDVVNLDLCGHVTSQEPGEGSLYEAIHNLVDFQGRRTEPWSMLLTTRVAREGVFREVGVRLGQDLVRLLNACPELALRLAEVSPGIVEKLEHPEFELDCLAPDEFVIAFTLALCMWIRALAGAGRVMVEVRSIYLYRVYGAAPAPDMASIVLRFVPNVGPIAPDPLGISTVRARDIGECEASDGIVRGINGMSDIDERLAADQALFDRVVLEAADLLSKARYDSDAYLDWVYGASSP